MKQFKKALHATPSDLHGGGTTSLFPAGQFQLITGGYYSPSYMQGLIREQWQEYCLNIRTDRKGRRMIVTFNGDMIDGDHHGTHEIISKTLKVQRDIASELIDEFLIETNFNAKKGDSLRFTMGTAAHVGQVAQEEEAIAEDFDAIPWIPAGADTPARYLWPELKLKINNTRFFVKHQGPSVGSRPHTRQNALHRYLQDRYTYYLEDGIELSDWYVFSHRHHFMSDAYTSRNHNTTLHSVITPSWQMRTMYASNFGNNDEIGGIYFLVDENDCQMKVCKMEYENVKAVIA